MRLAAPLLALLLAPALAGCLGFEMGPLDIDVDAGPGPTVQLGEVDVASRHDALQGRAVARVSGDVLASEEVPSAQVRVYLAHGACPMGPSGEPDSYADREVVELLRVNGTAPFEAEVSAPALPGQPMSVRVLADPAGYGPNFASCIPFVPVPE